MPPCETCRVDPIRSNVDAIQIFFTVQNQYIMGYSGPVAINQIAVHEAIKAYKIRNRKECFEKVVKLCDWWIGKQHEGNP
jgi:hypothetical protein